MMSAFKHKGLTAVRHSMMSAFKHKGLTAVRHSMMSAFKRQGLIAVRHSMMSVFKRQALTASWRLWLLACVMIAFIVVMAIDLASAEVSYTRTFAQMLLFLVATLLVTAQYGFRKGLFTSSVLGIFIVWRILVSDNPGNYLLLFAGLMVLFLTICWLLDHTDRAQRQMEDSTDVLKQQADRLVELLDGRSQAEAAMLSSEGRLRVILKALEGWQQQGAQVKDAEALSSILTQSMVMLRKVVTDIDEQGKAGPAAVEPMPDEPTSTLIVSPFHSLALVELYGRLLEELPNISRCVLDTFADVTATFRIYGPDAAQLSKSLLMMRYPQADNISMRGDRVQVVLKEGLVPSAVTTGDRETGAVPGVRAPSEELPYELGVDVFFNARHYVMTSGNRGPVHSHSWRVQARLVSRDVTSEGITIGFAEAKEVVQHQVSRFDGDILNEMEQFREIQPTTENVAMVLYDGIKEAVKSLTVKLTSVCVWESPTNYVVYSGSRDVTPVESAAIHTE